MHVFIPPYVPDVPLIPSLQVFKISNSKATNQPNDVSATLDEKNHYLYNFTFETH